LTIVLVCGGRNYGAETAEKPTWATEKEKQALWLSLDWLSRQLGGIDLLVEGDAVGADRESARWAAARGVTVRSHPAAWNTHGRAAGPIRNREMLDQNAVTLVVAFPGGIGTKNMVRQATMRSVPVWHPEVYVWPT
jgi:hypothetical protein